MFLKKGIMVHWTFKASEVLETKPVTYRLRDRKDEEIPGGFYDCDLKRVKNNYGIYQLEKILRFDLTGVRDSS
jgi:hypothetical protein